MLASPRLYHRPRTEVAELLLPLVQLPGFHGQNRRAVLAALALYATTSSLDFGDALLIAAMREAGAHLLDSYDQQVDRLPGSSRQSP